jgi:hypothetical protein
VKGHPMPRSAETMLAAPGGIGLFEHARRTGSTGRNGRRPLSRVRTTLRHHPCASAHITTA